MNQHRKYRPVLAAELHSCVGETVELRGWIHAIRRLGSINFIVLRDRSGEAQLVVTESVIEALGEAGAESVIRARGTAVENASAPGGFELQATELEVLNAVTEVLPVTLGKKKLAASLPTLLDYAPLTLRHPERRKVFAMSAVAMRAFRETLTKLGFTEIQTPKLVESATEGGSNVFAVEYFGRRAYLAQSPQFYKQTMVGVFERVFEVGPVFRAEPHATSRHINEYVSLDVEMGFIESHLEVMAVLREVLAAMITSLGAAFENGAEGEARLGAAFGNGEPPSVCGGGNGAAGGAEGEAPRAVTESFSVPHVPAEIPVVSFVEAKQITGGAVEEMDLSPAEERTLGEWAEREHGSAWLFVTGYPMAKRPFYTHPNRAEPQFSNSFDLLFRGQELVTGGQRLHRYADYLEALAERGLSPEPFEGYLQAFRYGMPPHGGFAIGLERLLMQLVGAENIREVTLFPRDINRLSP